MTLEIGQLIHLAGYFISKFAMLIENLLYLLSLRFYSIKGLEFFCKIL